MVGQKEEGRERLSKSQIFCGTKTFAGKFCANKIGQKTPKILQKLHKKGKMVINCAFLR